MNYIALEFATEQGSVAVGAPNDAIVETIVGSRLQAKALLPALDTLLKQRGWSFKHIDAIVFGCGPGSFTGLRVAASVAQGLGLGTGLPLIAVSSLAILAQTAYRMCGLMKVMAMFDARMHEIYSGHYCYYQERMQLVGEEQLQAPEKMVLVDNACCVGPGVIPYAESLLEAPAKEGMCIFPDASDAIVLADYAMREQKTITPAQVSLHYLRNNVTHQK